MTKKAELRNENLTKAIQGLTNWQLLEQYAKSYAESEGCIEGPTFDACCTELKIRLGPWLTADWLPCCVMAVEPRNVSLSSVVGPGKKVMRG